jgi:hypothetical protein
MRGTLWKQAIRDHSLQAPALTKEDNPMGNVRCQKCQQFGVSFARTYSPSDFIEGDPASPVWIIGINPAMPGDWTDGRSSAQLREAFADHATGVSYFRDFRVVSPWLFEGLGKPGGVAHTDLVKCSSTSWPPEGLAGRDASTIVSRCADYLRDQLQKFRPKLLICNGSSVCSYINETVPPRDYKPEDTSYVGQLEGHEFVVVLSGFVGRIDNHAKRRLGREIEDRARELELL